MGLVRSAKGWLYLSLFYGSTGNSHSIQNKQPYPRSPKAGCTCPCFTDFPNSMNARDARRCTFDRLQVSLLYGTTYANRSITVKLVRHYQSWETCTSSLIAVKFGTGATGLRPNAASPNFTTQSNFPRDLYLQRCHPSGIIAKLYRRSCSVGAIPL